MPFTNRTPWQMAVLILLAGCVEPPPSVLTTAASSQHTTVLLSVTSDAESDPQSVDMAMKLAGFSVDEGRHVVMFFNVRGVTIPMKDFPDDLGFGEGESIKTQLADLMGRGVDVHVCPVCMKALGLEEADLISGAGMTTRGSLFANIGPSTAVFTY